MFSDNINIMLYVDNVDKELEFWEKAGFLIQNISEMMSYKTFDMKPSKSSSVSFTVYAHEFIKKVSPEVADMKPSILFESSNLEELHKTIKEISENVSDINEQPFRNFNFMSPSGQYFAVKEVLNTDISK